MSEERFQLMLSITEAIGKDIEAIKRLLASFDRSLSNLEQMARDWPL